MLVLAMSLLLKQALMALVTMVFFLLIQQNTIFLKNILHKNYGGFSFFFELEDQTLNIGLNQYDKPVERNSAEAVRNIHILDYIVGNYTTHDMSGGAGQITDDQLLFEALRATEWYQTTNVSMREWQGGGGVSGKYSLVGGVTLWLGSKN